VIGDEIWYCPGGDHGVDGDWGAVMEGPRCIFFGAGFAGPNGGGNVNPPGDCDPDRQSCGGTVTGGGGGVGPGPGLAGNVIPFTPRQDTAGDNFTWKPSCSSCKPSYERLMRLCVSLSNMVEVSEFLGEAGPNYQRQQNCFQTADDEYSNCLKYCEDDDDGEDDDDSGPIIVPCGGC
jgi:hypothetical protein